MIISNDYHFQLNLISIFVLSNHMFKNNRQIFTSSTNKMSQSSDSSDDKDKFLNQLETSQSISNFSSSFKPVNIYENAQIQKSDIPLIYHMLEKYFEPFSLLKQEQQVS